LISRSPLAVATSEMSLVCAASTEMLPSTSKTRSSWIEAAGQFRVMVTVASLLRWRVVWPSAWPQEIVPATVMATIGSK
jgi:hypothetical protein